MLLSYIPPLPCTDFSLIRTATIHSTNKTVFWYLRATDRLELNTIIDRLPEFLTNERTNDRREYIYTNPSAKGLPLIFIFTHPMIVRNSKFDARLSDHVCYRYCILLSVLIFFIASLVRFSRKMSKLTLQFVYILCIYNIAVYTLICTGLLAFIAFTKNIIGDERERERENVCAWVCVERSEEKHRSEEMIIVSISLTASMYFRTIFDNAIST